MAIYPPPLMNPSIEIVVTLLCVILTSITAYGALTRQRSWFTLGICFFSTMPIIGELLVYAEDDNLVHLALVMVFLVQVVITLPLNIRYGVENPTAKALAQKIGVAILTANLCQGFLVLNTELGVPHQFGYLHLVVALIMLYTVVRSITQKEIHWR